VVHLPFPFPKVAQPAVLAVSAGAPDPRAGEAPAVADAHTIEVLELPSLLEVVSRYASTDLGADRVRALSPLGPSGTDDDPASDDPARVELEARRARQRETSVLLLSGETLAPAGGEPLRDAFEVLQKDPRSLAPQELPLVAAALADAAAGWRLVCRGDERLPTPSLEALARSSVGEDEVRGLEELAARIRRVLDPRGEVRPDASPTLARLRGAVRRRREALYESYGGYLDTHREELAGDTPTLRDGRLVVLLPSGSRGRLQGLVHSRSATGRSLYFEPLEMVESNNDLQAAIAEEESERQRLFAELLDSLSQLGSAASSALRLLAELDLHQAVQRFARACGAELPELTSGTEPPRLVSARHPLLDPRLRDLRIAAFGSSGSEREVVPVDLDFEHGRVLVVSGPNAGGKTVALKTLGLLTLMAACGLPVPAADGTRLPRLRRVLAVLGDEQDLLAQRSTFSAHLARLHEAWRVAGPGTLLLVDELASGTNPQEGAALAVTFVEHLVESGSWALVTTHLIEVAAAAFRTEGAASLATELREDTGEPTFRLRLGPPESSHALDLARRLGLPASWLSAAAARLGSEQLDLRRLLAEVHTLRQQADEELRRLEGARADQERANRRLAAELEEAREERKLLRRTMDDELARFRRDARQRLAAEAASVREKLLLRGAAPSARAEAREVDEAVERTLEAATPLLETAPPPEPDRGEPGAVAEGDDVRHLGLGWHGRVVRVDGERVEVAVKGKRVRVKRRELVRAAAPAHPKTRFGAVARPAPQAAERAEVAAELHLIGQRVEPALEQLDEYLDHALLGSRREVRVVHGHGTGRLRDAVRAHLARHPAVAAAAPAPPQQGGDGATVVTLRDPTRSE
jgi:DNA mismatch repair protein MutS2